MARNPFKDMPKSINEPARGAFAITPDDNNDLVSAIRQITIGTAAGTVSFVDGEGATHTTGPLPVGTYPLQAHRIRATGTTATGLTGWI